MTDKLTRRKNAVPPSVVNSSSSSSSSSYFLTVMNGDSTSLSTGKVDFDKREMKPLQIGGTSDDDQHPHHTDLPYREIRSMDNDGDDGDDDIEADGIYRNDASSFPKSSATAREPWGFWMSEPMHNYWFPPTTPRICQLFRAENVAIPMCYLLVGLLQGLSAVAVNVMPLDLGATEAQQTTLSGIRSLPASFKLLFGFLSDVAPIGGYRRKPYMMAGWSLASLSMVLLMVFSNLNIPSGDQGCFTNSGHKQDAVMPTDTPTIPFLSICFLLFGTGFWMADVMADSVVAEKAKYESPEQRGSIQSTCYAFRFFGLMAAAPVSTAMYTFLGPFYVIFTLSIMPLTILPLVHCLYESPHARVPTTTEQCREIWSTVCSRAVWQPLAFVYLYNVMQVGNSAWKEYLRTVHHFTSCQLNILLIVSFALVYCGVIAYKRYFISWSWRKVYIGTTLLNGIFSFLQVLLIYGITFGLNPFWFTLGDDAMAEFIAGIQFLPNTIMMVNLCPSGSEGASYAMFTTVHNSSSTLSSAISTQLLKIWDVSKEAFQKGDVSGMINLTYLTTCSQIAALMFVGLLPHYKDDLVELGNSAKSKTGGFIFLCVTFASITYAVTIGLLNILAPGWNGSS